MGALGELLALAGKPGVDDLRQAAWDDLHRLGASDRRVIPLRSAESAQAESWAWFDRNPDGIYLALNRFDGPLPDEVVDADRRHFETDSVWARVFELYHDPESLPTEARDVYRTAGDHVRHGDAPFHAHVFGQDLAIVDLDAADSDLGGSWRVAHPEIVRDLRRVFLRQWSASRPLLDRAPDSDVLELVRLLAGDRRDDEAAADLGVPLFAYRRRVADLVSALGAENRFAAGVAARRRGLVALAEAVA